MFAPRSNDGEDYSYYTRLTNEWDAGMRCNVDEETGDSKRRRFRRGDGNVAESLDAPPAASPHHSESPEETVGHGGQTRHSEPDHPTLKREMMRESNKHAARKCRQKKKEYVKCLETRVASLEKQNKTLIEEVNTLKDFYCVKTG